LTNHQVKLDALNLNRLRPFYVVYRTRSIRQAAAELHVTPAAASLAVKALERELAVVLFTRAGHGMIPTRPATALYESVRRCFADLDHTLAAMDHESGPGGSVRIGAPNGFGTRILAPWLQRFRKRRRGLTVQIRLGTPDRLTALLRDGALDLAIVPGQEPKGSGLASAKLPFAYEPRLVGSAETLETVLGGRRSYKRIVRLDHVALWGGANRLYAWYEAAFGKRPSLRIPVEVDNMFAAIATVTSGACVALLPSDILADELAAGRLVDLFPRKRRPRSGYHLVRLEAHVPFAAEKALAAELAAGHDGAETP
jgi:DNA-binding transcriptional LysR family regulator